MSDAILFGIIFVAFFIARIIAATVVFFYIIPESDRCPCCDSVTIRITSRGWNMIFPWFRTSWCMECGWEGMLRHERSNDRQRGRLDLRSGADRQ